MAFLDITRL